MGVNDGGYRRAGGVDGGVGSEAGAIDGLVTWSTTFYIIPFSINADELIGLHHCSLDTFIPVSRTSRITKLKKKVKGTETTNKQTQPPKVQTKTSPLLLDPSLKSERHYPDLNLSKRELS